MSPVFALSIAKQKGSHPCIHVSYANVVDLCCIISLYKNSITGFQDVQSCKTLFVACTCNIRCTLHQNCPKNNSTLVTNGQTSCFTSNTARQWSANCGPFSTFYWVAQHMLMWVFAWLTGVRPVSTWQAKHQMWLSWQKLLHLWKLGRSHFLVVWTIANARFCLRCRLCWCSEPSP